ncbi:MAG: hypothetical protein PHX78_03675 [bacterium]|nr:hypothetical protein [bacterium]
MSLKLSVILIFFVSVLLTAQVKAFDLDAGFGAGISCFYERSGGKARNLYRLGVPYLKEKNISFGFKEDAGVDLWFLPEKKIEVSLLSAITITKNTDGPFIFCGTWNF